MGAIAAGFTNPRNISRPRVHHHPLRSPRTHARTHARMSARAQAPSLAARHAVVRRRRRARPHEPTARPRQGPHPAA